VAPNVRILPVRVLGRCGGYTSDIVDGMRWAAGISIAGVPRNPNPARILNLSLGSAGTCSAAFQSAVNDVNARGAVVVVATGNGGVNTVNQPANCTGVVAVTAHAIDGDNGDYANIGAQTTLSAPGGGCGTLSASCFPGYTADGVPVYSLGNTGNTAPQADNGALKYGTSMAAPHVAGTIALMLSLDPQMTRDQVVTVLRSSARPFPVGTACLLPENRGLCGAGLLDAYAALIAMAAVVRIADANQIVPPLTTVALSASLQLPEGRTTTSIRWTPAPANPQVLTLMNADTLHASFVAPPSGTYGFTLTVTDNLGESATGSATVRVNSVPVLASVANQQLSFGGNLDVQLQAIDADGDVIVFYASALPSGVSLSASGLLSWMHASPVGRHRIIWYASDGLGSSLPGEVVIDVVDDGASSLSVGSGGGGSMEGDLLLAAAGLAIARRFRRR
jgi:serine protease